MTEALTPRKQALHDAILADFLKEGFRDFTIDAATKRYHCSKSTLYTFGKSRDEIVRRILISFFKEIAQTTEAAGRPIANHAESLFAYFDAIRTCLEPASAEFMHDLATEPVAQRVYDLNTAAAIDEIMRRIESGIEAGEFNSIQPAFAARMIQRSMQDIQQGEYSDVIATPDAYRELGRIVLRGLDPPAPAPASQSRALQPNPNNTEENRGSHD